MSKLPWETLSVTSRRGAPTSRRQNFISLPRRDVDFPTSRRHFSTTLSRRDVRFHVAMSFAHLSVTSRRGFTRRDVIFDPLCHVATWIYTSRRDPVFSPRMVHFVHSPHAPSLTRTLAPLRPILHRTCRRPHPTGRRPSTARRPL